MPAGLRGGALHIVQSTPIRSSSHHSLASGGGGCGGPLLTLRRLYQEKQRELVKTIPDERLQFEISTIEEIPVRPTSLYDCMARAVGCVPQRGSCTRVCACVLTTLAPSCT
jgi:hypothetical protein